MREGKNETKRKELDGKRIDGKAGKSIWAYLPVGPLERQSREGIQGGFWEEVPKNPQERVATLLRRNIMGKPLLITKIDAFVWERLQGASQKMKNPRADGFPGPAFSAGKT
jgi:hypothetical protein